MSILCLLELPSALKYYKEAKPLLLSLYLHMDNNNLVNKGQIALSKNINMCNRTLNKYWHILEDNEIIVKTKEPKVWMINPKYVRLENNSHKELHRLWEEKINEQYN